MNGVKDSLADDVCSQGERRTKSARLRARELGERRVVTSALLSVRSVSGRRQSRKVGRQSRATADLSADDRRGQQTAQDLLRQRAFALLRQRWSARVERTLSNASARASSLTSLGDGVTSRAATEPTRACTRVPDELYAVRLTESAVRRALRLQSSDEDSD